MRTEISIAAFLLCANLHSQEISFEEFQEEAKLNKELLPKYGNTAKTEEEKKADEAFIKEALILYSNTSKATSRLVESGYKSLEDDPKYAMNSFNKAFLIDSTNANIYCGYGMLYDHFDQYEMAYKYYQEGLDLNPRNTMLLNAMAKNLQNQYVDSKNNDLLKESIEFLHTSFRESPNNSETSKLLSLAYMKLENCDQAKLYFKVYLAAAQVANDDEFVQQMEEYCRSSN